MVDYEKELVELSIVLDPTEYDDEEEFEDACAEYDDAKIDEIAKGAAEQGSTMGMHNYGRRLMHKAMNLGDNSDERKQLLETATFWITKAAMNGCAGAVDDLACEQADILPTVMSDELAFYAVNNGIEGAKSHAEYLSKHGYEVADSDIEKALVKYEEIQRHYKENSIELEMCGCIF